MEITLKLIADPKLETLLDKLCNALNLGNSLSFTDAQIAPAKPAPVVPTAVPTTTATTTVRSVHVNPTPATPVETMAPFAQHAIAFNAPTAMTANAAPVAAPDPTISQSATAAPQQKTVPIAAPTYQIADLARAAATLMDAGKQPQLLALLAQFDVQSLGQLKPEQFGQFATALRGLGAKV